MARLPYLTQADLKPEDQKLLARDIALMRLMVHSPGATRAFQGLGGYIRNKSTLDGRLRELAILQVGWLARSPYEWSHHVKIGYDFGVSDADIQALIDDTAGKATSFGAVERCVLRAAREMTVEGAASDATFKELQGYFSTEHLTDLVVTIAFYCAVVRFLATMAPNEKPMMWKRAPSGRMRVRPFATMALTLSGVISGSSCIMSESPRPGASAA